MGIESSIESGYTQIPRTESTLEGERVSAKWSSSIVENSVPPQFKRGHREYSSPFTHDRAAESVPGSAWTVGRTIAPGFGPRDESDKKCSPGSSRLRFPGWSMARPSSKAEAAARQ